MSKKSAHVNNKMEMAVNMLGLGIIETITVHPNMVQLPSKGDLYSVVKINRNMDTDSEDATDFAQDHEKIDGRVSEVLHTHAVVRTKSGSRWTTELVQNVVIMLVPFEGAA